MILVKVDKMTSANGLLALAPLFSRRIIETSMACPPRLKLQGNIEKGILKAAMTDLLPAAIINRPKSGMMVPVRFWMQGEMRRYARRLLSKKTSNEPVFSMSSMSVKFSIMIKARSGETATASNYGCW